MRLLKRWLVPTVLAGGALAWRRYRRGDLDRLVENLRRYSAPSARLYDAVTAPLLREFFTRMAGDLAELAPQARVLEVGSGPGRLAATIAKTAPGVQVTGVDITPEMVQRASVLAARSGVADRVAFTVGDVAALPFGDASFEVVVSTLSAHHWPDPVAAWPRSTGCCARAASLGSMTWSTGCGGSSSTEPASRSLPPTAPSTAPAPTRSRAGLARSRWSTAPSSGANRRRH
jgi:SAM-dependent methyltransferase